MGDTPEIRVMSWNVQGAVPPNGSKGRIRNQVAYIKEEASSPGIIMLNEVTTVQRDLWRTLLQDIGYVEIVDTLNWAAELRNSSVPPHQDFQHSNGNIIALHQSHSPGDLTHESPSIRYGPWEDSVLKDWTTNFPEKILNAEVTIDDIPIDLWNVRAVPGNDWGEEKIKILENTYNRIRKSNQDTMILAGDFNSPKDELTDGTVIPWGLTREEFIRERWTEAELNILDGLGKFGFSDVFRDQHGYGKLDVESESWAGKRFDHMFASGQLNPVNCYYDPKARGDGLSDHSALFGEFEL